MEQELKRKTLVATSGGVMKALQLEALAPALADFTYSTDDPFVVEVTITTFLQTKCGAHAESSTWLVGRDLIAQGLDSSEPVGEGDIAVCYDVRSDQVAFVLTDSSERNPEGVTGTHRLVLDGAPIRTFIRHSFLLVPAAEVNVDKLIADVLAAES